MLKEADVILKAIADGLKSMADGFYSISRQLNDLTKNDGKKSTQVKLEKKRTIAKPKAKKKATPPKKRATASTDVVFEIINKAKTPVDNINISKKTGFDAKKVANVVYRLKRQGKIKSVDRGTYKPA
jgi:predicted Rossmann fold nucleotide-binding protein DprA/Smf involved in DNA uptake